MREKENKKIKTKQKGRGRVGEEENKKIKKQRTILKMPPSFPKFSAESFC